VAGLSKMFQLFFKNYGMAVMWFWDYVHGGKEIHPLDPLPIEIIQGVVGPFHIYETESNNSPVFPLQPTIK
jgi:hypothetical protein